MQLLSLPHFLVHLQRCLESLFSFELEQTGAFPHASDLISYDSRGYDLSTLLHQSSPSLPTFEKNTLNSYSDTPLGSPLTKMVFRTGAVF